MIPVGGEYEHQPSAPRRATEPMSRGYCRLLSALEVNVQQRRNRVAPIVLIGVLTLGACSSSADRSSVKTGQAPAQSGHFEIGSSPIGAGVDTAGNAWVIAENGTDLSAQAFTSDVVLGAVQLERTKGQDAGRVAVAPWGEDLAVAHLVCADAGCSEGAVALDVVKAADSASVERLMTSESVESPGPPRLLTADDESMSVAAGSRVIRFFRDGSILEEVLTGQQGDPCVIDDRVLVATPRQVPDSFEGPFGPPSDDGLEPFGLTELKDRSATPVPGSETSLNRSQSEELRCSADGLQIALVDQPALRVWDGSGKWISDGGADEIPWQLDVVSPTATGLLGVLGGSLSLVDSGSGETLQTASPPVELGARWDKEATAGPPTAYQMAIGASTAIVCYQADTVSDTRTGVCDVF